MSYTANSSQPQTRHKSATATVRKTRKELEEAEGTSTDIRNKEQALALLRTREYLVPGEPINPSDLSYALLQFAYGAKLSKAITDIIRAFAFAMTDIGVHHTAEDLVSTVKTQLSDQMELYNTQVETMRDAVFFFFFFFFLLWDYVPCLPFFSLAL
ncbi:hypothetical protein BYT27DRAFT_7093601 [Phlegmacium glaucopus]|nr:hypothetical protein BYT27DRAFT_7093601 [Phlegmacium glaucopus]